MKFYIDNENNDYWNKTKDNKLTSIFISYYKTTIFFKNGIFHNNKNSAYINKNNRFKVFYLNGKLYGYHYNFTKESWRRFIKLQAFL
jgi:hypothetical protein